jgi:hypothetical protein
VRISNDNNQPLSPIYRSSTTNQNSNQGKLGGKIITGPVKLPPQKPHPQKVYLGTPKSAGGLSALLVQVTWRKISSEKIQ